MSKNRRSKKRTKKPDDRSLSIAPNQDPNISRKPPREVQLTQQRIEQFSGPIPPPETLAKYEEVLEGSANRIIAEFETQTSHRRSIESKLVGAETRDKVFARIIELFGQAVAFAAMMGVLIAGVYVASMEGLDSKIVGGLLSGSSLIGIVRAFIQGRNHEKSKDKK